MAAGYWVVRTYTAGRVGEKVKYWMQGERPDRATRRERDALRKAEQNESQAERRLARVMNANFRPGDWLLGLDYSKAGMERLERRAGLTGEESEEERLDAIRHGAEEELRACIKRVNRLLAREGRDALRYVAVTSDMDGDTGEAVRVHHHLVVPREAREAFVAKWQELGLGGVSWSALSGQEDYTPIAAYLMRQVRRGKDEKAYMSSRNLVRPQPRDRIARSGAELRVPKGAELLFRSAYRPGQAQYIRYILPGKKDTMSRRE